MALKVAKAAPNEWPVIAYSAVGYQKYIIFKYKKLGFLINLHNRVHLIQYLKKSVKMIYELYTQDTHSVYTQKEKIRHLI